MDATLHIVLTAVEIVALVAVLAIFLLLLTSQLRSLGAGLQRVSAIVQALEGRLAELGRAAADVNASLDELAGDLPGVAQKAEGLVGRR
jgi:uncharacterized protein YoxC